MVSVPGFFQVMRLSVHVTQEGSMRLTISAKKLNQILEELKEISRMDFMIYSAKGEQTAGTVQEEVGELAVQFIRSLAETQVAQGWIFFRVEMNGKTEYVLLCSRGAETEYAYTIGRMALCQIRNLFLAMRDPENRKNVFRQILNGEISGEKMAEKCHQVQLRPEKYMLYVIQYKTDRDSVLVETVKNLFVGGASDYVIEMDGMRTVLLKCAGDIPDGDYERYARTIVDNLQTEAMVNVWVGYGVPVETFEKMNEAYLNACTALKIGIVFYGAENVFCYEHLGIARLIYKLPADLCEIFLEEVLGENKNVDFDEETLTTISQLFENNLNISETARQLYIHRNTLVYRLERIEKRLGLDIRSFEDAMIFKIAMMVRVHLNELQKQTL